MTFIFAPAVRTSTPMIIGIAGPSGSGKTYTALTLATGLAGAGGKVALIDTEGRRALHYADLKGSDSAPLFRFDHCDMESPYEPRRFLEALQTAEKAGYAVIVVDSFSDEYVGEGGLVDIAAAQKVTNEAAKWAKPKAEHKLVVRWLRQSRCHLIFCLRAEEKVRLEKIMKDGREQTVVVPIGWQPICEKNVPYEMATSFMLTPEAPGVPRPIKIQEQHRHLFPTDRPITRDSGVALAVWCAGGAAPKIDAKTPAALDSKRLLDEAYDCARTSSFALRRFWASLRAWEKREVADALESDIEDGCPQQLKAIAEHADKQQNPAESSSPAGAPLGQLQSPLVPGGATS